VTVILFNNIKKKQRKKRKTLNDEMKKILNKSVFKERYDKF
jgi:hypothetical protein